MDRILNIIVIDSNSDDRDRIVRMLNDLQQRVWVKRTPDEVADLIEESHSDNWKLLEPIHAVFVGVYPDDGSQTADAVESQDERRGWKTLAVGIMDGPACEMMFRFTRFHERLRKPLELEEVREALSSLLERVSQLSRR